MNDKELRYITAIADAGSIQQAALLLERHVSSLSRCVKRVEAEHGIRIFRRTPGGLLLTPEGEVYVKAAREILVIYDQLRE